MSSDWSECCLDDVVAFETGHRNSQDAIKGGEYPFFICSKDVLEHSQFDFDKEAVIMAGNNADANFHLHYYKGRFAARQRTYVISPKYDQHPCRYFYYALHALQPYFKANAQGTTTKFVTIGILKNAPLALPPPSEQKAIAHILGRLDDKIELNRKTNETLEGIAKALFKSWFVDFDPVRAKAEGRPTGLPDEISELFPDSFEESELGEIPIGWKVGTIRDDVGDTFDGPHATPKESLSGNVFLGIKNMTGTSLDLSDRRLIGDEDWAKWTKRVTPRHGDIVFTYEAALGMFAVIPPRLKCCLGRRMALVRLKESGNNPYFWFHQFISDPFQRLIDERAIHGATVNRTPLTEFPDYPVIVPTRESISCFENVAKCLWERLFVAREESQSLGLLRDALLPRLISGELRVPDAEKMLEEAGI